MGNARLRRVVCYRDLRAQGITNECRRGQQYDVIFVDQVSAVVPLLQLLTSAKVGSFQIKGFKGFA